MFVLDAVIKKQNWKENQQILDQESGQLKYVSPESPFPRAKAPPAGGGSGTKIGLAFSTLYGLQ